MATTDSQAALAALPTTKSPHALPINSNASTDFTLSALSDESDNYRPSISLDNNSMHSSSLSPPFSLQDNHHNASQDSFLNQYHEQFEKTPTSALQQRCSTINKQVHHHHQQHPHDQQINYQNLNSYTFCSVCKKQDEVCDCADQSQDVCNNNNNQWSSRMEDPKNQMLLVDKHQEQYSSSPNVLEAQFKFSSGQQTTQYGYVNQVQLSSSSHSDQQVMISVASGDFPSNDAQLNYNYAQDANNLSNNPVNQDWMLFNNAPNVASTNESYALDEFAPTNSNHTDASQVRQLDHSVKTMDDLNNNSCSRSYAQPDQNSYTHYQQHFEVNSFYQQVNCIDSSDHNHNRYQHYEEGFNKLPPNQLSSVNYENRLNAVETSVVPLFGSAEGADGKEADRSLKSRSVFPSQVCLVESEVGISRSRFVSGMNQQISSDCLNEQARYDNNSHYVITNQPVEVEIASRRQVDQPQQVPGKARSPKGRRGRPRKKGQRSKSKVNGKLWEFIRDLLLSDLTNPNFIRWERREDGVFKFVQSDKVAKMWGERKQNPKMTYEKLSRAMRYYYKTKVLLPVFGRRLVYKFGPNATGWRVNTLDEV